MRLERHHTQQGRDVKEQYRTAKLNRGVHHEQTCCCRNGSKDEQEGEGNDDSRPGEATAAIADPVGCLGAAAFHDEPTIGKDPPVVACLDNTKHEGECFETFFRSGGCIDLLPVHSSLRSGSVAKYMPRGKAISRM